jgi:hypothetical protein
MIILLALAAIASEVARPVAPDVSPPLIGQCAREVAVSVGEPVSFVVDGLATCSGVLVPTTKAADLLRWRVYADELDVYADWQRDRWRLDVANRDRDLLWSRARIAQLEEPPPWWQRPAAQKWGARAEMLAIVGLTTAVFAIGYEVARAD